MSGAKRIRCMINKEDVDLLADPRLLLIELIRDVVGLKGARIGCLTGDCGSCTALVDGRVVKTCLVLAVSAEGHDITTIEGADDIADIKQAFVAENGFQCGYCTTGMVLTAAELLRGNPSPTDGEIRRALVGNLCRCTGYEAIVSAVRAAALLRRSTKAFPGPIDSGVVL